MLNGGTVGEADAVWLDSCIVIVPQFSTHTTRHLCLTDLARMGWELHAIATFAGHRSTDSTLAYIHLSGRDLADKLARGMEQIHGWRVRTLAQLGEQESGAVQR